ncbi:hypothetical protein ACKVMT_16385 [Halobacteriales archaeon Cl-PHB]
MSNSQPSTDDLGALFVSVTGDETVTEPQEPAMPDREIREDQAVDEAVDDGLADAIDGAQPDTGDPGETG